MKRTVYEVWIKTHNDQLKEPIMVLVGKFYKLWAAELFQSAYEDNFRIKPAIIVTED